VKDSEKRARIAVCYEGLLYLVRGTEPITRKEFFQATEKMAKEPTMIEAIRPSSWQKTYVERLVDAGYVNKATDGVQVTYSAVDKLKILMLIKDHDEYGLKLSSLLFPHEVVLPEDETKQRASEPERMPAIRQEAIPMLETAATLNSILDGMLKMAPAIVAVSEKLISVTEHLDGQEKVFKESLANIKNRLDRLNEHVQVIENRKLDSTEIADKVRASVAKELHTVSVVLNENLKYTIASLNKTSESIVGLYQLLKSQDESKVNRAISDIRVGVANLTSGLELLMENEGNRQAK